MEVVFHYNNTLWCLYKNYYFLFGSGVSELLRIQKLIHESRSHIISLKMAFIQFIHSTHSFKYLFNSLKKENKIVNHCN